MEVSIEKIAQLIGGTTSGNTQVGINMLSKIQDAEPGQLTFLSNPKYEHFIYSTRASAVLVDKSFVAKEKLTATLVFVDDPYTSFARLIEEFSQAMMAEKKGVEEPAFLGNNTSLGNNIYRGAFSYIANHTTIGDNVKIYQHAYIGEKANIGDNTIIYQGARIMGGVQIGKNCIIGPGAVIGSDGFGFAPQKDGSYKSIPQLGTVVIEEYVSIGANTTIDCATLPGDATIIRQGTKLDNLIQVGHNVEVGKHTVIAAQTGISGSAKLGDHCMVGGQVGINGHITIANNSSLAATAAIHKSIKKEGEQLVGAPALNRIAFYRSYAVFKKLPELDSRLEQLEKQSKIDK